MFAKAFGEPVDGKIVIVAFFPVLIPSLLSVKSERPCMLCTCSQE